MYQNICRCITLYSLLVKDDFERENWRFWIFGGGEKKRNDCFYANDFLKSFQWISVYLKIPPFFNVLPFQKGNKQR